MAGPKTRGLAWFGHSILGHLFFLLFFSYLFHFFTSEVDQELFAKYGDFSVVVSSPFIRCWIDTQRLVFWGGTKSQKEWSVPQVLTIFSGKMMIYESMMKHGISRKQMINHGIEWGFSIIFKQPSLLAGASKLRWRFAVFSIVAYASIDNLVTWCGSNRSNGLPVEPVELWWGMLRLYRQVHICMIDGRTGGREFLIYVA